MPCNADVIRRRQIPLIWYKNLWAGTISLSTLPAYLFPVEYVVVQLLHGQRVLESQFLGDVNSKQNENAWHLTKDK